MARNFSNTDAKRIIEQEENIERSLGEALKSLKAAPAVVKKAADTIVANEVLSLLRGVPVEELNKNKEGIRIKALMDSGYSSMADCWVSSVHALASVSGISENTAYTIKRKADNYAQEAAEQIKIKISSDNRTPEITSLVKAVSIYKNTRTLQKECSSTLKRIKKQTTYRKDDLNAVRSGLSWFFSSKSKKEKAEEAYSYLSDLVNGEIGQKVDSLLRELQNILDTDASKAWEDFNSNSVQFFNILEEITPGLLGNSDSLYGLPEELAREIQDECIFPDGLLCTLRRYQEWGVKYILHQERVLLGDEMGLGKTIQAIATMVSLKNTGATHFVVVCPASVIANWCKEITKHSKLRVTKVHGNNKKAALNAWIKTGGVAVTTYETSSIFVREDMIDFSLLVVDEAHYIKNPTARRSKNVTTLSYCAERLLFMTGTALENNVDEMIGLISILRPEIASEVRHLSFMSAAPQFREKIAPVYYRRKREDVLTELPELIESQEWLTLGNIEESVYERSVLDKNYQEARRVSWSVDDLKYSCKATRLKELVEEAESEGRKVIVFTFFLDTARKIFDYLGSNRCMNPINGSVNPKKRQEIIDDFEQAPPGSVLISQIQSGGTGLNIQAASVVIICEPQFKPSIENQAISRAYRMGQTRNVLVYRMLCECTVDERITEKLAYKQQLFDAFADRSEAAEAQKEVILDDKGFGEIIEEEIERINKKNGNSQKKVVEQVENEKSSTLFIS